MSTFTFTSVADVWPVGTSVSAYLPGTSPAGGTSGSALATAAVASDGSLIFTGLADDTRYVATDGTRSKRFRTSPPVDSVVVLKEALPSPAYPEYGAVGDGITDNTAIFAQFVADKGLNVYLPDGIWKGTFPHADGGGIQGAGKKRTILRAPARSGSASVASAAPVVDIGGSGGYGDDAASIRGVGIDLWSSRRLDEPIIKSTAGRNVVLDDILIGQLNAVTGNLENSTAIATLFAGHSSYQYKFSNITARGTWLSLFDWVNDFDLSGVGSGGPPQCDTSIFDGIDMLGPSFMTMRQIGVGGQANDVHGFRFANCKIGLKSATGLGGAKVDTTMTVAGSVGDTTITVNDATESWSHNTGSRSTGQGQIAGGSVLSLDAGTETAEMVRVLSVSGNVLTLHSLTPLRYVHGVGCEVVEGGVPFSLSNAIENIDIGNFHFERFQVAMALGSIRGLHGTGVYNGSGLLMRVQNNTNLIRLVDTIMFGTPTDGSKTAKNEFLRRGSSATGTSDGQWVCDGYTVPSGAAVQPLNPIVPHGTRNYVDRGALSSTQISEQSNANTGQETAKRYRVSIAGTEKAYVAYGGEVMAQRFLRGRLAKTANYTIVATDPEIIALTATASPITITLPAASAVAAGTRFTITDESNAAGTNNITVSRAGTDTILNGTSATTAVISTNGASRTLQSDGFSKWAVV